MARIRSIKPEFFQHEAIFEAEHETGLPLRLAYVGLWTQADRRGLFRWRPRELKLNILPYDDVDFGKVMEALATYGFVTKYEVGGFPYGVIPTFAKHQVFNVREKASANIPPAPIPDLMSVPTQYKHSTDTVPVLVGREGKGREGIGKGKEGESEGEPRTGAGTGVVLKRRAQTGPGPDKPKHDPGVCQDPMCCEDGLRNLRALQGKAP